MSITDQFDRSILAFIAESGATATYHQYLQGDYNTSTSEYDTIQVDTTVQLIILDLDRITSNGLSTKFNTLVLQGDKEGFMRPIEKTNPLATPIIPNPASDRITVSGSTYKIVIVKESGTTGSAPLLYNFLLRR